jgi:hypothetical protein
MGEAHGLLDASIIPQSRRRWISLSTSSRFVKGKRLCEKIDELPVYLKELKDKSGALLNDDQKCLLDSLLKRHINTFSKTKDDLGRANGFGWNRNFLCK